MMLWFSHKKRIEIAYRQWLATTPVVADCPFNVISFLDSRGWLNRRRILMAKLPKLPAPEGR